MTDYHEDVMQAAREVVWNERFLISAIYGGSVVGPDTVNVVAAAIMAERERCAKIADRRQQAVRQERHKAIVLRPDAYTSMLLVEQAAEEIAAAIRGEAK
jgi:hypothetical protein